MKWLVDLIHGLPRFDFALQPVKAEFRPTVWKYWESLGWWSAAVGIVCCILLLIVAIVWIVRCCLNGRQPAKRVAHVRKLSFTLFFLSVMSFVWLGVCFFGNERVNRGVIAAADELGRLVHGIATVDGRIGKVRDDGVVAVNRGRTQLDRLVDQAQRDEPKNDTLVSEVHSRLENMSLSAAALSTSLDKLNKTTYGLRKLDESKLINRIEFERWVSFCVLYSIMVAVLFGSVVGFCRYSKKAAVLFSGIGLVIYLLGCVLLCAAVAVTIAVADACHDIKPCLWDLLTDEDACTALKFYERCASAGDMPPVLQANVDAANTALGWQRRAGTHAAGAIKLLWPDNTELSDKADAQMDHVGKAMMHLGAATTGLQCRPIRTAWNVTEQAVCVHTIVGASISVLGLVMFVLTIHMLLLLVAKAWFLYSRQPLDYVEVDDDDPFVPRAGMHVGAGGNVNGQQGAGQPIAVDVYGTYNYNARGSGGDSDGNDTMGTTPLWSRGAPPPALATVQMRQDVYEVYS